VKSCQRFGGEDCEALYEDAQELCVGPRNKSLYAETYPSVPGSSPTGVYVDRPLGTFADYKPSSTLLPTSSLDAPPAYYDILPYRVSTIGKGGEPILSQIPAEPFVPDSGGYEVSELGNSEFGLLEFIRERLEKNTEFNCATFESPFHYQKCMNLMKCKKFSPPYNGKYFLPFCPKTLSGGRLR
jgi:hypothetical protein